jgi:biopolymer transport protein ExbD/DNA-directed RNA polymerase subunit RPC12/RpoP
MSIRFRCPKCKTIRSFHRRLLGREIRCPDCDATIVLPTVEQVEDAERKKAAEKSESKPTKAPQSPAPRPTKSTPKPAPVVAADEDHDDDDEAPPVQRRQMPHDHIDMTPMVDITFLLLIFFMSTANFTLQKAMEVPVKKSDQASTNAVPEPQDVSDFVTVQIDEFNAYKVMMGDGTERDAPSKQDLIIALDEAREMAVNVDKPEKLVVDAHRDCMHAAVISALDAGRDQGFTSFQVSVVESFD